MLELKRWCHPEFGLILPDDFIQIADEIGFIEKLDAWVFNQACEQIMLGVEQLMVNIASYDRDSMDRIIAVIRKHKISAESIIFEVTERHLMKTYAGFPEFLQNLNKEGVGIAIDDFGVGYSSLGRLRTMPVKFLKIDKSFVWAIGTETSSEMIIKSIVVLAKSLPLDVIAEGIESKEQLTFLIENGCLCGQGFLYE